MAEIEFDPELYEPLPVYRPAASRKQTDRALDLLAASHKPLIMAGGGVINADAADLLQRFAELAGMVGLQTSTRYGNASWLASDVVIGIGNRWANRHTAGIETHTRGRRFVHIDIEPTQIGRVFALDLGIVSDAGAALRLLIEAVTERQCLGLWPDFSDWAQRCAERKRVMLRKTHFDNIPIKPQRLYEEMNQVFGRDTVCVSTIGLSPIVAAQLLHVYGPRQWINCGKAGPLGWTLSAALGVVAADPTRPVVAISGDCDFQFLIEALAVGAQLHLPYVHVLVNNAYLDLIRQSQRGFDMDYCVQLAF